MARIFRHAVTGRSIRTREGSRVERLVTDDKNWSEVKPESKRTGTSRSKKSKTANDEK